MTPIDLLQTLQAYCEEKTKGMQLLARVPDNGTESATRPPRVYIGNLPDKEAEKREAPYILLKFLTGKTEDKERKSMVRIICVTFSEDKQDNYIQCLNVVSKLEQALLEDVVIGNRYSCQKPIETIVYDDDLEIYQIGEIMTIWEMPQISRNVREYL